MYFALRRIFDTMICAIALIVLSPILLIIALAVAIDSKGGVVFKQLRIGKNGKPYYMYKFRTMVPNAQNMGTGVYSFKDDPRITRVGRFLRKTSLDELLQLWNVDEPKGEYVLVLEGKSLETRKEEKQKEWQQLSIEEHMDFYESQGVDRKEAMKKVAKDRGLSKRDVYQYLLENS